MAIDTTKKIKQVTYNGTEIPLGGYDTSDATVTASDLANGVVAYGKNGRVVGDIVKSALPSNQMSLANTVIETSDGQIWFKGNFDEGTVIASKSRIGTYIDFLGDATAADVAKGKTFTSAAGMNVTGTAEGSSAADVTFDLYNNGFANLVAVYMSKTDGVMDTTIPNSDHKSITTSEGSMVVLINQDFNGDSIDLVPDNGVHIAQGWRMENVTMFVAGAETNGMNIDVNIA